MLWGVGTGRCGTKSLAKMLGGVHEPEPWIDRLVYEWRYDWTIGAELQSALKQRKRDFSHRPIVVDCHHSWCMPLILAVDHDARFAWVERDFEDVCESFMRGGAFTETDDFGKYKACPYHVAHSHPREVCVAAHVSQLLDWIRESFDPDRDMKFRCPEDLTEWENVKKSRKKEAMR